MTVSELVELSREHGDCQLTIHKDDDGQTSACTTVPVETAHLGFDWTHNQFVLYPAVKLKTHPDHVAVMNDRKLKELSDTCTRHLMLASTLARFVQDIDDERLQERFMSVLRKF